MTEIFWSALIGSMVGLIILIVRYCCKWKCTNIDICGIHITRDTNNEHLDVLSARQTL